VARNNASSPAAVLAKMKLFQSAPWRKSSVAVSLAGFSTNARTGLASHVVRPGTIQP
jgi:hypothetical protein